MKDVNLVCFRGPQSIQWLLEYLLELRLQLFDAELDRVDVVAC